MFLFVKPVQARMRSIQTDLQHFAALKTCKAVGSLCCQGKRCCGVVQYDSRLSARVTVLRAFLEHVPCDWPHVGTERFREGRQCKTNETDLVRQSHDVDIFTWDAHDLSNLWCDMTLNLGAPIFPVLVSRVRCSPRSPETGHQLLVHSSASRRDIKEPPLVASCY